MNAPLDIAVLVGGVSSEREVSLVTGEAVVAGLREFGHAVRTIDTGDGIAALVDALTPAPDAVFNALHGRFGEDGTVQGLLELLQIPYTHSGVLASALAMDKPMAKRLFEDAGIRCAEHRIATRRQVLNGDVLPRPYVVNPMNEGSSVGVQIVTDETNGPALTENDWPFGDRIMVERYIAGREITVAVMGDRALGVTELRPVSGFYDYEAKYTDGKTDHIIPADLPEAVAEIAREYALKAHETLSCRGVTRADFRYDDAAGGAEAVYLLEINTQPGLTPLSLVPEQAAHAGISFPELVNWMVEHASCGG